MKLLVVDPHRTERLATLRLVPADCYEVTAVRDATEALAALDEPGASFDVALIESTMTGTNGNELVTRIRARESSTRLYVVMTAARTVPGDLRTAIAAGADDFIRKPIQRDELIARIEAPIRIRRWATKLYASGTTEALGAALTSLLAWTRIEPTLCTELSEMVGFELVPAPAPPPLEDPTLVAAIPLTLSDEQAEVRLAVGVDVAGARRLAEMLLGGADADEAALKDMLREIANVAAGAFKRTALADGRTFTTGVPSETSFADLRAATTTARRGWLAVTAAGVPALRFEVQLRVREPKRVKVSSIREGMVVAADLRNALGALLVRSGTRISESHLGGLVRSLGADALIDVLEAA